MEAALHDCGDDVRLIPTGQHTMSQDYGRIIEIEPVEISTSNRFYQRVSVDPRLPLIITKYNWFENIFIFIGLIRATPAKVRVAKVRVTIDMDIDYQSNHQYDIHVIKETYIKLRSVPTFRQ